MKQLASPPAVERPAESEAKPGEEGLYCHCRESGSPESRKSPYCLDSCLRRNDTSAPLHSAHLTVSTGSNDHHLLGWSRFLSPTSCGGFGRVDTVKLKCYLGGKSAFRGLREKPCGPSGTPWAGIGSGRWRSGRPAPSPRQPNLRPIHAHTPLAGLLLQGPIPGIEER
jgi:hypothetical protein